MAPDHHLSWWDGRWWCSCGAAYVVTDVDALQHYHMAITERDKAKLWLQVVED